MTDITVDIGSQSIDVTSTTTSITIEAGTPAVANIMRATTYDAAGKAEQVLTVSDLLDEDNFATDSATKVPSQQSTKAYMAATYQPLDADLTTIAGLAATTDNFIVSVSSAWASRTPSQARTTLGLATSDSPTFTALTLSGGKISFPATQSASSDANTLDDYEEGSWTPAIAFGGGTTGITYSTQTGLYTKVGNIIILNGRIVLTAKGSSTGTATMTGLPFTSVGSNWGFMFSFWGNMASLVDGMKANMSGTGGTFYNGGATASPSLNDTNFTDTTILVFNGQIRV